MRESKRRQRALEALPLKATAFQGASSALRRTSVSARPALAPPRPAPGEGRSRKAPDTEATEEPRGRLCQRLLPRLCRFRSPGGERTAKLGARNSEQSKAGESETARREPLGVTGSGERAGKQAEAGRDEAAAEARDREGEQAEAERRDTCSGAEKGNTQ